MTDYDKTIQALRHLSVSGNMIAATYLHLLYNCRPDERSAILAQIETFARSFSYEVGHVGPTEYKDLPEVTSWSIKI